MAVTSKFFHKYFSQNQFGVHLARHTVVVFRRDGHLLYSNASSEVAHTYTALLTGAWHSAQALMENDQQRLQEDQGRLSFEFNLGGMMVSPFHIEKMKLFLGVLYTNEESPGKLKANLRLAVMELENIKNQGFSAESRAQVLNNVSSLGRDEYLFKDITDKEIDNLFHFSGI